MTRHAAAVPGLLASAALATAAFLLADQPFVRDQLRVSALLLVILLGMAWRALAPLPAAIQPGVRVAQRPLLRWAVAGLGFRLSLGEIAHIGGPALAVVTLSTTAGLAFGWWIARRLGVNEKLGLLLGVGGAICGASAVVAADSVVQGEKRDSALAVAVITLLGTTGIVVYPWVGRALGLADFQFGVWAGASLHEMAQVVAAGAGFSHASVGVATVVKLVRICLLAPVVFWLAWRARAGGGDARARVSVVPWFLVLFVVFAALVSTGWVPKPALARIGAVDTWMLCAGMAGVGLQTSVADLVRAGLRPIAAGVAQWAFLAATAYALARVFCR